MAKSIKLTYPNNKGKIKATEIEFFAWNGIPKLPKPSIEAFTRLGGDSLIIQQTKTEAVITNSTAFKKIQSLLTGELEQHIEAVHNAVGKRGTWFDGYSDTTIDNFYILDCSYSTKMVDPGDEWLVVWNILCTTDKYEG
jgi:hypothetical protein